MSEKETKDKFKVSDKRRFVVDEEGKVKPRDQREADQEEPRDAAASDEQEPVAEDRENGDIGDQKAQDKKAKDIDLDECECEEGIDFDKLPPIDFNSFVFSMATTTMIFLGILPEPGSKETKKNLGMAKQHIDLLGLIQEKTAGNLSKGEAQFIEESLYDLRMRFVQACEKKS